jgi:hypothetical protein
MESLVQATLIVAFLILEGKGGIKKCILKTF